MTPDAQPKKELTFLFTDVERSSAAWLSRSLEMVEHIPAVNAIVERECAAESGRVFGREGDGRAVQFDRSEDALTAAIGIQRQIHASDPGGLRVRIGVHGGEVFTLADGQLGGTPLNYVGRLHSAGHGGQILVSDQTHTTSQQIEEAFSWTDLGQYSLRDFGVARIWQLNWDGHRTFEPLRTRKRFEPPTPMSTPFFGRQAEADRLDNLGTGSQITITGPGGIGKTAFVRHVIESQAHRFADGICFVDLQRVTKSRQVPGAVANALGIDAQLGGDSTANIANALAGSEMLIVLDNCEHVASSASELATAIAAVDGPTVISTSRTPLGGPHEIVFPVGPLLDSGGGSEPSIELFVSAARRYRPDFSPGISDAETIEEICARLGHMPLAVELAAARLSVLSPAEVAAAIRSDLAFLDRVTIDEGRSLTKTLQWTLDHLGEDARIVASALALGQPDMALEQASEILPLSFEKAVDGLERLVRDGVVRFHEKQPPSRYSMLPPFRDSIPEERLTRLAERHSRTFTGLATRLAPEVEGDGEVEAVDRLTTDYGNLRRALVFAVENGDADRAARTLVPLHMYCFLRMRYEYYQWVDALLNVDGLESQLRSELHGVASFHAIQQGRFDQAERLAAEADRLASTAADRPITSRVTMVTIHGIRGKFGEANDELIAGLRWCDEHESDYHRSNLLVMASMGLTAQGMFDLASEFARQALAAAESITNPSSVAWSLTALADARSLPAPTEAVKLLESALEISRSVSNRWVEGQTLLNLSRAYRLSGSTRKAVPVCAEALGHCQQQSNLVRAQQGLRESVLLLEELESLDRLMPVLPKLVDGHLTVPASPDDRRRNVAAIASIENQFRSAEGYVPLLRTDREAVSAARAALLAVESDLAVE